MRTHLILSIRNFIKGVPYSGVDHGTSINHGFKILKGQPAEASKISEVQDNESLNNALVNINAPETALFTIGCEKSYNNDGNAYWVRGYIELAFNYARLVGDAQPYFKLFYDFFWLVQQKNFDLPLQYHWELEGNHFIDAKCDGLSVVIWITTADLPNAEEARATWNKAVDFLSEYLASIKARPFPTIY